MCELEYHLAVVRACNEIEVIIRDLRTRFKGKVKDADYSLGEVYNKLNKEREYSARMVGMLVSKTDYLEE